MAPAALKQLLLKYISSNSIYDVLRPTFWFSFVFGMTPFNIATKKFAKVKWSAMWTITVMAFVAIFFTIERLIAPQLQAAKENLVFRLIFEGVPWSYTANVEVILASALIFRERVSDYQSGLFLVRTKWF